MKLIGVTGSFGKTSVCEIVYQYMLSMGYKVSLYSSNGLFTNGLTRTKDFLQSTLYIKDLERYLYEDKEDGIEYGIIEITGESAKRKDNIHLLPFEVIALTSFNNGLHNHYKSKEDYLRCKREILENGNTKSVLLRVDDPNYSWFSDINHKTFGYSDNANYQMIVLDNTINGLRLKLDGVSFETNLITAYHARNMVAAIAILKDILVFDINSFVEFSKNIFIRGRFEKLNYQGKTIILDTGYSGAQIVLNGLERTIGSNNFKIVYSNIKYDDETQWVNSARANNGKFLPRAKFIYLTTTNEDIDELDIFQNQVLKNSNYKSYIYIKDNTEAVKRAIEDLENNEVLIIFTREYYRNYRHIIESLNTLNLL